MASSNNRNEVCSVPRYIPMPESIWALRRRFPTVTRSILLQCVRCHRWVAQPVTTHIPNEVPTYPAWCETAVTRNKSNQHQQPENEKEVCKEEWRSPRLRKNYDKVIDVVKSSKSRNHNESKKENLYFIPNPANFTCQWTYCVLEDVWKDLREQWIGELYAALDSTQKDGDGESKKVSLQRHSQKLQQDRLNEELAKELHGRRSERLARRPHAGFDLKHENSETYGSTSGSSQSGKIAQHVNTLLRKDEAVVASFCWISCEYCGKLRRVHQPFPGGTPFVCALALNIGSCSVPEHEGLGSVFRYERRKGFAGNESENIMGDIVLRDVVRAESLGATGVTSNSIGSHKCNGSITTTTTTTTNNNNTTMGVTATTRRGGALVESSIPFLRELTLALRKKALGAFVRNIMLIPDEVRRKREEVVRASCSVAEENTHMDYALSKQGGCENEPLDVHNGNVHDLPLQTESQQKPKQQSQKRENNGNYNHTGPKGFKNVVHNDVHTHNVERGRKEEVSLRSRRMGCPPRNMPFETKKENTHEESNRVKVEPTPVVFPGAAQSYELRKCSTAVKFESVATPCNGGSDVISGSERQNGECRRMRGTELAASATTTTSGNSTRLGDRRRTGQYSSEKNDSNNNKDNRISGEKVHDIRRSSRQPSGEENVDTKDAKKGKDPNVIHWACCDLCKKWRIVPEKILDVEKLWSCDMRGDGTTCRDTDDWVLLKRSRKRQRASSSSKK